MNSYDSFFHQRLVEKITAMRLDQYRVIANNLAPDKYNTACGFIRALDEVIELCNDVRKELNSPD
jgi:hypothetical protein